MQQILRRKKVFAELQEIVEGAFEQDLAAAQKVLLSPLSLLSLSPFCLSSLPLLSDSRVCLWRVRLRLLVWVGGWVCFVGGWVCVHACVCVCVCVLRACGVRGRVHVLGLGRGCVGGTCHMCLRTAC